VPAKKIESRGIYHTSDNKYLSSTSSSRVLPMQGTCSWEADVQNAWNRPRPPDEGCKWRKVGDRNYCECLGEHWVDDGIKTAQQCAGVRITPDASPIKAQCWQRKWVSCSDSTCESRWGPNPDPPRPPFSCGPGRCLYEGICVDNDHDYACGFNCRNCIAEDPGSWCYRGQCIIG